MNSFKYLLHIILAILLCAFGLLNMQAQDIVSRKSATFSLSSANNTDYKAVEYNNSWHAVTSASASIKAQFELVDTYKDYNVESYTLTLRNNNASIIGSKTINAAKTDTVISFSSLNTKGTYAVYLTSLTAKSTGKDAKSEELISSDKGNEVELGEFNLELYNEPRSTSPFKPSDKTIVWSNKTFQFTVGVDDGNKSGWKYKWNNNDVGQTYKGTITVDESSNPLKHTFSVEVSHYAPDGNTLWGKPETYSQEYTIWLWPTVSLQYSKHSNCPKNMHWYAEDVNVGYIYAEVSGGAADNWEYKWYKSDSQWSGRGDLISTENTFTPQHTPNGNKQDIYYSLVLTNTPEGIEAPFKYDSGETEHTITFWKSPNIQLSTDYQVFEESVIPIKHNLNNEYLENGEWVFTQKGKTSPLIPSGNELLPAVSEITETSAQQDITISWKNTLYGNFSSLSGESSISVKVWNRPTIKQQYRSNNPNISSTFYQPTKDGKIHLNEYFGGNAYLSVFLSDSSNVLTDVNYWKFNWSSGSATKEGQIPANSNGSYAYTVGVEYTPVSNIYRSHTENISFDVEVHEQPFVRFKDNKTTFAGLNGETVDVGEAIEYGGGYGSNWAFAWKNENDDIISTSTSASIPISLETQQKKVLTFTCDVMNHGPEGDEWPATYTGASAVLTVYAYPKPVNARFLAFEDEKIFTEERMDDYRGSRNYSVSFDDDYTYTTQIVPESQWEYLVEYQGYTTSFTSNNQSINNISRENATSSIEGMKQVITNDYFTHGEKVIVKMRAQCFITDPTTGTTLIPFNQEETWDYYTWDRGHATIRNYAKHIKYDDEITLSASITDGYRGPDNKGGWSYEWQTHTSDASGVVDSAFTHISSKTDTITVTDTLICTNRLREEIGFTDTLYFTYKEYPKIVLPEIIIGYPTQVREGDEFTLKVSAPKGGNLDGWKFSWNGLYSTNSQTNNQHPWNGQFIAYKSGESDLLEKTITAETYLDTKVSKGLSRNAFSIRITNDNPNVNNGTAPWVDYTLNFDDIIFYLVPQKPSKLIKKGGNNNQSGIFIALFDDTKMTSTVLEYRDYHFSFGKRPLDGWTDDQNSTIVSEVEFKNYHRYEDSSIGVPDVRSLWIYDDGFKCYSDYTIYGKDDNTPSNKSTELSLKNARFSIVMEEDAPASVWVYSLGGEIVKEQHYAAQKEFDEQVDIEGLAPGLYILKCSVGNQQEVEKLMVR